MLFGAIDTLLDRTIASGYGRGGYALRRRLPGWPEEPERLDGRAVLVTGAASGIGLAAARQFAGLGARVLVLARTIERAHEAADAVRAGTGSADVAPIACDLGDLHAVGQTAQRLMSDEPRLDVLVHNAGLMTDERRRSADGHELMFAVHVLAPFALTAILAGWMGETAHPRVPGRIVWVSSGGMYSERLDGEDLESERVEFRPARLYARTKRAQVILAEQWAARLDGSGVVVHAMHPGWVRTESLDHALPRFARLTRPILRPTAEGADTIVWLGGARAPARTSGGFWMDRRERPTRYRFGPGEEGESVRARLWAHCIAALREAGLAQAAEQWAQPPSAG